MSDDVLITFLPNEIIELILENDFITVKDTVNFALSNKQFYKTVFESNKIWRVKLFQRWPNLKETINKPDSIHNIKNWLAEVQYNYKCRKELINHLSAMSIKYFKKQELSESEFKNFDALLHLEKEESTLTYHYLIDELLNLISKPVMQCNLTHRYYAFKVIRYLKQNYLKSVWQKFTELDEKKQLLEEGATIVAQWSQPEKQISYEEIRNALDDIAEQSKVKLKESHPNHPIFSTSKDLFEFWKNNNIEDNQWTVSETRQVLTAVCDIMFNKLGFHGNSEMFYSSENTFINKVIELKRGIPITLAIVFESVSRRLGVKCEPVSFPTHFLLRWREKYVVDHCDGEDFYIDVFSGGQFLTRRNCPRAGALLMGKCPVERYNIKSASSPVEVVDRMAMNLEVAGRQRQSLNGRAARLRSALELLHLVRPYDANTILNLARFYMLHQMDLGNLYDNLIHMQQDSELSSRGQISHIYQMMQDYEKHMNSVAEEPVEIKIRTPDVKYAVGMIMKHRRYDYLCVITGWDVRCKAAPEWMIEMGIDELDGGANQPFYSVFADDGSSRYAAQENLSMATVPGWVNHYETGRYFCYFKGTHYVPNEEKTKEYPEDADLRDGFLSMYL